MSSIFINLAFMTKTAASQFISAKLENAKSVKNNITDQQQNSDNITDLFDVSEIHQQASELSAFYQCLDHSCVNIQT